MRSKVKEALVSQILLVQSLFMAMVYDLYQRKRLNAKRAKRKEFCLGFTPHSN